MKNNCLVCGNSDLKILVDFGSQPAANLLTDTPRENIKYLKLALSYCEKCGHAQQDEMFPTEELFGNYLYQSGTSKTLNDYFEWFAMIIENTFGKEIKVLEIACNDGSLLKKMALRGIKSTGVDPAKNLASLCNDENIKLVTDYWPTSMIKNKYNVVIAMNVLAHGPNPFKFLQAVKDSVEENGFAFIQVSQINMFNNCEFDTVYHEHYSFFCANSLFTLAKSVGFKKIKFMETKIHGDSLLAVMGFENSPIDQIISNFEKGDFYIKKISRNNRPQENDVNKFSEKVYELCNTLANVVGILKNQKYKIILVGVAAKAITVLQASKIQIDLALDEASLKIGKFIPGTECQIKSLEYVVNIEENCLFIIGAWNFKTEISKKLKNIRNCKADLVCTYFPKFTIENLNN